MLLLSIETWVSSIVFDGSGDWWMRQILFNIQDCGGGGDLLSYFGGPREGPE